MKTQDIHSMLGIAPSTLSDWSKEGNKKNTLAKLLKNIDYEDMQKIIEQPQQDEAKPVMLLSTVNCSIGNKKKHFTLTGLKKLFYKKDAFSIYDKYVLRVLKQEALEDEISDFINYYRISPKRVDKVLLSL